MHHDFLVLILLLAVMVFLMRCCKAQKLDPHRIALRERRLARSAAHTRNKSFPRSTIIATAVPRPSHSLPVALSTNRRCRLAQSQAATAALSCDVQAIAPGRRHRHDRCSGTQGAAGGSRHADRRGAASRTQDAAHRLGRHTSAEQQQRLQQRHVVQWRPDSGRRFLVRDGPLGCSGYRRSV